MELRDLIRFIANGVNGVTVKLDNFLFQIFYESLMDRVM